MKHELLSRRPGKLFGVVLMHADSALGERSSRRTGRFQAVIGRLAGVCWRALDGIGRRPVLACAVTALLPVLLRLAALPVIPIPEPVVHDEFAYLLGAETFASGRLTNPTPQMWQHFETFHEIFQPSYMSKYPPGQSLVLAAGIKLLHNPWFGVVLGFGVMSACICWMLQGWLSGRYAFLAAMIAVAQIGIFDYWMDSYSGGAVAAAGGSLLLGAVPRLAARTAWGPAVLGAIGLIVIGNTRPFEGLVTAVAGVAVLLWWRRRNGQPLRGLLCPAVLLPVFTICAAGGAAGLYYNYRVTGDPLLMPYVAYQRAYSPVREYFYLSSPTDPPPVYRHEVMRKFYTQHEGADYWKSRRNPLHSIGREVLALAQLFSAVFFVGFASGAILSRRLPVRFALTILAVLLIALALEVASQAHYYAPVIGLFFVPVGAALRFLKMRVKVFGSALVLLYAAGVYGKTPLQALEEFRRGQIRSPRQIATAELERLGGRHLVIVRYSPDHDLFREVVSNHADINRSAIVWARDMGEAANRELLTYYADRKAWLFEPDRSMTLQQYCPANDVHRADKPFGI